MSDGRLVRRDLLPVVRVLRALVGAMRGRLPRLVLRLCAEIVINRALVRYAYATGCGAAASPDTPDEPDSAGVRHAGRQ